MSLARFRSRLNVRLFRIDHESDVVFVGSRREQIQSG